MKLIKVTDLIMMRSDLIEDPTAAEIPRSTNN